MIDAIISITFSPHLFLIHSPFQVQCRWTKWAFSALVFRVTYIAFDFISLSIFFVLTTSAYSNQIKKKKNNKKLVIRNLLSRLQIRYLHVIRKRITSTKKNNKIRTSNSAKSTYQKLNHTATINKKKKRIKTKCRIPLNLRKLRNIRKHFLTLNCRLSKKRKIKNMEMTVLQIERAKRVEIMFDVRIHIFSESQNPRIRQFLIPIH